MSEPTSPNRICSAGVPTALTLMLVVLSGGCGANYQTSSVTDPDRRAGHVYMIRGLFNIFSTGMGGLTDEICKEKVDAHDCAWATNGAILAAILELRKKGDREPIVLGGHSNGADDAIKISQELADKQIPVDLVILIDEFLPPAMPRNVKKVLTVFTRGFGSVAIAPPTAQWAAEPVVEKFSINPIPIPGVAQVFGQLQHFSIDKDSGAHQKIVHEILATCPTRVAWNAQNGIYEPVSRPTLYPTPGRPEPVGNPK